MDFIIRQLSLKGIKVTGWIFFIIAVVLFALSLCISFPTYKETHTGKFTDCYDKQSNIIQNQTCEVIEYQDTYIIPKWLCIGLSILLLIVAFIFTAYALKYIFYY
jgi:hypothetical protein